MVGDQRRERSTFFWKRSALFRDHWWYLGRHCLPPACKPRDWSPEMPSWYVWERRIDSSSAFAGCAPLSSFFFSLFFFFFFLRNTVDISLSICNVLKCQSVMSVVSTSYSVLYCNVLYCQSVMAVAVLQGRQARNSARASVAPNLTPTHKMNMLPREFPCPPPLESVLFIERGCAPWAALGTHRLLWKKEEIGKCKKKCCGKI